MISNSFFSFVRLFKKCRKISRLFRKSGPAKLELDRIQKELNEEQQPLSLTLDCETRWNSTLHMISRILDLKEALNQYWDICDPPLPGHQKLSETEFTSLKDLKTLLSPLAEATTTLSGRHYVTLSNIIPMVTVSMRIIDRLQPSSSCGIKLRKYLLDAIQDRFCTDQEDRSDTCISIDAEANSILQVATYLDPRFKDKLFRKAEHSLAAKTAVADFIKSSSSQSPPARVADSLSLWDEIDSISAHHGGGNIDESLRCYESSPLMKSDPLKFSDPSLSHYPAILKLKQKYYCIPATSVPSESLFSSLQLLTSDRRSSLGDENIEFISFLHVNLPLYEKFNSNKKNLNTSQI